MTTPHRTGGAPSPDGCADPVHPDATVHLDDTVHLVETVYLDHAAATPVLPEVVDAVTGALALSANPSSQHAAGRRARQRVEESREQLAAALTCSASEVVLTSGGTEGANLAVCGLYRAAVDADPRRRVVLLPPLEHHAVLDAALALQQREAAEICWLDTDPDGRVLPGALAAALASAGPRAALVTTMAVNNETGAVSPVAELAAVAAAAGVPLHVDAAQAVGLLPPADCGVGSATTVSFSGHKLGAPAGTGAVLVARDARIAPWTHGGGHERGIRSGSLDVAGAAGLATAVTVTAARRGAEVERLTGLRDALVSGVLAAVPDAVPTVRTEHAAPHIAHLRFPGAEAETLLALLDAAGIACSAGAACTAGVVRASHVLLGMGLDEDAARSGLRFSLGRTSSAADVAALVAVIGGVVATARAAADRRRARAGIA